MRVLDRGPALLRLLVQPCLGPSERQARRPWREAGLLSEGRDKDLLSICDLPPEDRKKCLLKTHEYFRTNPAFQMRGRGSGFVLLGKGPALDAEFIICKYYRFIASSGFMCILCSKLCARMLSSSKQHFSMQSSLSACNLQ